jgi:hypothetical protein
MYFFYFLWYLKNVNIYVVVYFHTHHGFQSYELVNVYPVYITIDYQFLLVTSSTAGTSDLLTVSI